MSDLFTIKQIVQLHEIEEARTTRGEAGLRAVVQELVDRLTSGGVAGKATDPRESAAKRFWDLGVGRELGHKKFKAYFATIPQIPAELVAADAQFPHLVLVETRVGLTKLCSLGGIAFSGNDETLVPFDDRHKTPVGPYWIRMQDGRRNRNRKVSDCRSGFKSDELGLAAVEGVCTYLQYPVVIGDLSGSEPHAMDLPGSVHRGIRGDAAYLIVRDGQARLRWGWVDGADPSFGSASRRECKR